MIRLRAMPAEIRRAGTTGRPCRQEAAAATAAAGTRLTDTHVAPDRYAARSEHKFDARGREAMAERDREIGRRAHALIAGFCRAGVAPEATQVWVAASELFAASPVVLNHGSRQRAACAVSSYFLRFFRADWRFAGAEVDLGSGRADLVWCTPAGLWVVDEVKTGSLGEVVEDRRTLSQVGRYREAGLGLWGERFAGVRLLPLTSPGRARFHPADGPAGPLQDAAEEVR